MRLPVQTLHRNQINLIYSKLQYLRKWTKAEVHSRLCNGGPLTGGPESRKVCENYTSASYHTEHSSKIEGLVKAVAHPRSSLG